MQRRPIIFSAAGARLGAALWLSAALFCGGLGFARAAPPAPDSAAALALARAAAAKPAAAAPASLAPPEGVKIRRGAEQTREAAGLRLRIQPYAESLRGTPGYSAKLDFLQTDSAADPQAAEIGRFINAQLLQSLFAARQESAAESAADYCADSAWKDNCANTLDIKLDDVETVGSFIALRYQYSYMPIGAAHPMHSVLTYNFSLKPLFLITSAEQIFADADTAFPLLQKQARALLAAALRRDAGAPLSAFEEDMLKQGTESRRDFANFMLTKTGLKLVFSPYAVAPYAFGTREAEIPYAALKAELKPFYARAGLDERRADTAGK